MDMTQIYTQSFNYFSLLVHFLLKIISVGSRKWHFLIIILAKSLPDTIWVKN